jgi:polysaccharide export outer membrane protein
MNTKIRNLGYIALLLLFLGGCASQKEITYLQDVTRNYRQTIAQDYDVRINSDDLLSIMVNSKDPELVQMFNLPMVSYQVTSMGYLGGQQRMLGYLVDKNGNIKFPQLGEVNVRGLNRFELSDLISNELKERGLVNDAVVTVQFLNFKVSVMGEVVRPGTFEVDSDRITLLDALSLAGDMTIYGRRDNVRVIREENGERTVAIVDLRSRNLMNSPYYYLKQNDIVYVEPNKARAGQREINQNRSVSTFASILSVLASLASLAVVIFR